MSTNIQQGTIVSIEWLSERLGQKNLVVLDASIKPAVAANTSEGIGAELQIPGTRIFDFDKTICNKSSSLPHMMPTLDDFEREVRNVGINNEDMIVIYDRMGIYASPRAWWMLKAMGHNQVAVLDGGFPAWLAAQLPVEPISAPPVPSGHFIARPQSGFFVDGDQVAAALSAATWVLDARSEGRFYGREPEPRIGLRGGHIPGSRSMPFQQVLMQGKLRPVEELQELFHLQANHDQSFIFSCGSGVTSCILALAATQAGYRKLAVYDGSWSEWGLPDSGREVALQ